MYNIAINECGYNFYVPSIWIRVHRKINILGIFLLKSIKDEAILSPFTYIHV